MIKKPLVLRLVIIIAFLGFVSVSSSRLLADDTTSDLQNQINQYTQKLLELGQAKKTLKNEISYISSKIELTRLQIVQTQNSIKILQQEISVLVLKIDQLDLDLNSLSSAFIQQTTQNYKNQRKTPPFFSLIFGNFNQFLNQYKYLTMVQKNSRDTLLAMETVRSNYDLQKQKKAQKQKEMEALQKQLSQQKANLAQQKEAKNNLLTITKNDESRYQKLKAEAEAELQALLSAKFVGKRQVEKDEALGTMGNTGYSFGDHLHFGLYQLSESQLSSWSYVNDTDPSSYLGQHRWPMETPIRITQARGHTQYSYLYSDRFHHGVDMVAPNKTIVAVNDGMAYFFRNPQSSLGNHIKLFHNDGKMTLYLHLK